MSTITAVALLVLMAIPEGFSQGIPREILRCQCINKERTPIGRYIGPVEVIPASSHCKDTEIIATYRIDGTKVCLDPDALWVQKVLKKIYHQSSSRHVAE
ncbi:interleukin-8-like isoform X1 [Solea senegalensis]|uniref:Interleukin-8-like isoform X1 n=1 Tax=Solea senegalensis TaxID=28829 RepID=A0AAV6QBA3_SOLSE|nr:C-X-C motif chemokine 10-like [Solea senegalensis]KAG7485812.1 interleukin-8-like isoform X1 [Solea senegalensis]